MRVVIGLGANLGDRVATLDAAVQRIGSLPGARLVARSSWRETEPIGGPPNQPRFVNGAVLVETTLEPELLLARLLEIERELGRDRDESSVRFGPRAIDLDLLLVERAARSSAALTLPHPRLRERVFALEPLLEVWPDARDPRDGARFSDVLAQLLCDGRRLDTLGS